MCTYARTHLLCLLFCNNFFPMAMDQTFVFSFAKMVIVSICTGHVYNTDVCRHWLLHLAAPLLTVDFALKLLVLDILDHNLNRFSVLKNHSKSTFFFVFFLCRICFSHSQNNTSLSRLQSRAFLTRTEFLEFFTLQC